MYPDFYSVEDCQHGSIPQIVWGNDIYHYYKNNYKIICMLNQALQER